MSEYLEADAYMRARRPWNEREWWMDAVVCLRCGAIVVNQNAHNHWHIWLARAIES